MNQVLFNTCAFLLCVPTFPFIGVLFIALLLYRALVTNLLKLLHGRHFKGFLEGLDAIWNVEDGSSRSMLNLLFFIECPASEHSIVPAKFLESIRQTVAEKLMCENSPFPRLFWKRNQTLGFCFWTNDSKLTIDQFVRFMEPIRTNRGEKFVSDAQLSDYVGKTSNQHLPDRHTACWELLVGKQITKGTADSSVRYPMLLRLHHTAGDGMAIARMILDTITGNHAALAARISAPTVQKQVTKTGPNYTQLLKVIVNGPAFVLRAMLRRSEKNCLTGGRITDNKVISWYHERDGNEQVKSVIDIVKSTKQLIPGARFSDVFLVALANSLHKYFESKGEPCPDGGVSVIIPGRAGSEAKSLKIKNRFTTRQQLLQITSGIQLNDPNRLVRLRQQLSNISQGSASTRTASSHAITTWFISSLTNILPIALLRLVVSSFRVNIVFSILPEIEKVSFQGHEIVGPTLFLPNTGNISVCLAVITFDNKVHLGILADRSVIPSEDEAHSILEEIVTGIERMGVVLEDAQTPPTIQVVSE